MASQLRTPTLNERRCIIRHHLGFYRGMANAAVYSFQGTQPIDDESCLKLLGPALQQCVEKHPILGAVIDRPESEDTSFRRLAELQLSRHIHLLDGQDTLLELSGLRERAGEAKSPISDLNSDVTKDERDGTDAPSSRTTALLRKVLEKVVNLPFTDVTETPPWRLFVLPMPSGDSANSQHPRLLVVFNYSHSHGDGLSGLVFHRTFRQALSNTIDQAPGSQASTALRTGSGPLPPPPGPWPLSWPFFLGIIANEFLPWLPKLLFWRPAQSGPPWCGRPVFYDGDKTRSGVRLVTIDAHRVGAALQRCKVNGIKLTGLVHLLIVRGVHMALKARGIAHEAFSGTTPVDLRRASGLSPNDMTNGATAISHTFLPPDSSETLTEIELQSARELGTRLAQCSSTTHDQVVGMLKYAEPIGKWVKGKIGKPRSETYELSNLMSFDPLDDDEKTKTRTNGGGGSRVDIDSICWTQPADVTGQVFTVNLVSLKGGNLSIGITWQYGALGIVEEDAHVTAAAEDEFMNDLSSAIQSEFVRWANDST